MTEQEQEQLQHIRANAALVVETMQPLANFEFGYTDQSVKWLDGFIERTRIHHPTEDEIDRQTSNLGSYLGEAIIAAYGGAWACDEHGWHIRWSEKNRAYPFSKVAKHVRYGAEDSIYSFYSAIRALPKG